MRVEANSALKRLISEDVPLWGAAIVGIAYGLLHLLLLGALVTFGQRAGGYPLNPLAILVYGMPAAAGTVLALWRTVQRRGEATPVRLLPLLVLAIFLAPSLAGVFFATERLPGDPLSQFGLHTSYPPYLDDDGAFAWRNAMLAIWMVALALAANWRGLLVGAMAAQGLALWLNPGLIVMLPAAFAWGVHPELLPLLVVPVLYVAGAVALGWRGRRIGRVPIWPVGLIVLVLAVLTLGNLASVFYWVLIFSLPVLAWRLHRWAASEGPPGGMAVAGAGLALLAVVSTLSWPYLGPGGGMGDNYLPREGQAMGWIGKTVPEGAYSPAGDVLQILKLAYPWLLAAAGAAWLSSTVRLALGHGVRATVRAAGSSSGLVALAFAMLFQVSPFALIAVYPLPVYGFASALPRILGESGLSQLLYVGYTALALGLLGLAAALRRSQPQNRGWLAFGAMALALAAASILSAGMVAGTLQSLEAQQQFTLPEYRQAAQLRLALSLPVNAAMAALGWGVVVSGLRAVRRPGTGSGLSSPALRRGLAAAAGIAVLAAFAFWQFTAMPVAETYPQDGATDVPTNAPVIIQLTPGERNWGPGISARYADTGERVVPGTSGGFRGGGSWFAPKDGWRPNSRVEVQVCCGPFTRSYRFSFTTGTGPSPDVPAPPGPTPAPTPARPALSSGMGQ
ncbi:MAG: hypothetical protein Q8P00_03560 [Dehalococcoidia bacterium]|nr:hypothetical protein [Dehalococcoidia bacterium]